jgi:hypothetical protein
MLRISASGIEYEIEYTDAITKPSATAPSPSASVVASAAPLFTTPRWTSANTAHAAPAMSR